MANAKKTRFSPKAAKKAALDALLARLQLATMTSDAAQTALKALDSLPDGDAKDAMRQAAINTFAGQVRVSVEQDAAVEDAISAIACTVAPTHVLVATDVVQDMRDVANGLPAGKLIAGLWSWFVQTTKPAKRGELLKEWAERPDTRDFSPENVLRVAGLWDEAPTSEDEQA